LERALNGRQHLADNEYVADERVMRSVVPRIDYDLIQWHGQAALVTVLISAIFGILVATKFNFPIYDSGHKEAQGQ
jgi:hypothetical protein